MLLKCVQSRASDVGTEKKLCFCTDPQKAPHKTGAFEKLILARESLLSFSFRHVNWGYISELKRKK